MSTLAKLLAQRQQLLERLRSDPGPREREDIEALLNKIDVALELLEENAPAPRRPDKP